MYILHESTVTTEVGVEVSVEVRARANSNTIDNAHIHTLREGTRPRAGCAPGCAAGSARVVASPDSSCRGRPARRPRRSCHARVRSNVVPHPVRARGCGSPGYPAAVAASTELRLGVEPVDPSVFGPSHRTAVALWYSSGTAVSK